jgi:hypothetical protein
MIEQISNPRFSRSSSIFSKEGVRGRFCLFTSDVPHYCFAVEQNVNQAYDSKNGGGHDMMPGESTWMYMCLRKPDGNH